MFIRFFTQSDRELIDFLKEENERLHKALGQSQERFDSLLTTYQESLTPKPMIVRVPNPDSLSNLNVNQKPWRTRRGELENLSKQRSGEKARAEALDTTIANFEKSSGLKLEDIQRKEAQNEVRSQSDAEGESEGEGEERKEVSAEG